MLYMITWIPSIYPLYVSIYTSTVDPSWDSRGSCSTPQKDAKKLEVNDGDMIHDPNSWKILEICVLIHFLRSID